MEARLDVEGERDRDPIHLRLVAEMAGEGDVRGGVRRNGQRQLEALAGSQFQSVEMRPITES